jgi:hypothetical protein
MSKRGGGNKKAYENGLQKYVNSIRRPNEEVFVENSNYARHHMNALIVVTEGNGWVNPYLWF